jgi:raffinose/stachyose/melibiose transport system permease protein
MTWNRSTIWLFLFPALLIYGMFTVYPTVSGLALSFTDSTGIGQSNFIGMTNYLRLFEDPVIKTVLVNTLIYTSFVTIVQNGLGLLLAIWLANVPSIRDGLRVAFIAPAMLSGLVLGYVWSYLLSPLGGPLNETLKLLGLGTLSRVWLGDPSIALIVVASVHVWMYVGYSTAIFMTGYLSLPRELLDSAEIDGASGLKRFWYVEWPLLAPATTVAVTLSLLGSSKAFDLPFILTNGGPGDATRLTSLAIFQNAFAAQRFGYGAAIAVVTTLLVIAISSVVSSALRRREAVL